MDGYTFQDLFDTQDALDNGLLNSVEVGTITKTKKNKGFLGFGADRPEDVAKTAQTSPWMADANSLGSILGQTDAIAAFKKRKLEQQKMAQAGVGTQQSILGGGAF